VQTYKLLRLNEDDEQWAAKMSEEHRLLEDLRIKVERTNWVTPVADGAKSGFRRGSLGLGVVGLKGVMGVIGVRRGQGTVVAVERMK
jgi:hypothetical protein